jgi:hypothetical protein
MINGIQQMHLANSIVFGGANSMLLARLFVDNTVACAATLASAAAFSDYFGHRRNTRLNIFKCEKDRMLCFVYLLSLLLLLNIYIFLFFNTHHHQKRKERRKGGGRGGQLVF